MPEHGVNHVESRCRPDGGTRRKEGAVRKLGSEIGNGVFLSHLSDPVFLTARATLEARPQANQLADGVREEPVQESWADLPLPETESRLRPKFGDLPMPDPPKLLNRIWRRSVSFAA